MPDNSERRQEGTEDHAGDSGDLQLGHAIYARHAHFPGANSVGSHIVGRIARFHAGSSSLGQRLYRRWAGAGSGFSWPDMEWLHANRGGQATAPSSSPQRTPASATTKSGASLGTAPAHILRSTVSASEPIDRAASSLTAPSLNLESLNQESLNQESFAQKVSGVRSDSAASTGGAPRAGTSDGGLTPQSQPPIVSTWVEQQNPRLGAESTPVLGAEQKTEFQSSTERQQGKPPFEADANASLRTRSGAPVYLGRAILQRSTERGLLDSRTNVSRPPTAAGDPPAGVHLEKHGRELSRAPDPTNIVNRGQTIGQGAATKNQYGDQGFRPADQSSTVGSMPLHLARAIPQRSEDTEPGVGAAPIARAGSLERSLHSLSAPSSLHLAPGVGRGHLVHRETVNQAENGPNGGHIPTGYVSRPGSTVSNPTESRAVPDASGAQRREESSAAKSAESQRTLASPPATSSLNPVANRPAAVFRSLALAGSGAPFTPGTPNYGAQVLERHRESLITHPVDVGRGHSPDKTVVQSASSVHSSQSRTDSALARSGQNDPARERAPQILNLSQVVSRAPSVPARSEPLTRIDAVDAAGDAGLQSGLETTGAAPESAAHAVIQRESDSVVPGMEGRAPVMLEQPGTFDGTRQTHRMPDETRGGTPTAHGTSQAALGHLDRSGIRGPSTLERASRVHRANDGHRNVPPITISGSRDSLSTKPDAGSGFSAAVRGASVLHHMVHRSSPETVQARAFQLREPSPSPFPSVSLTHRAPPVMDGLPRSPASVASGAHFLARQSDGSPAPSTIPAAVPLPSASSSSYQASGSFKNVDVGQLASRVYDLLVRRLATERQRRGL